MKRTFLSMFLMYSENNIVNIRRRRVHFMRQIDSFLRTDLAVEAKDMYMNQPNKKRLKINGLTEKVRTEYGMNVTRAEINEEAAEAISKKAGKYVTIYTKEIIDGDTTGQNEAKRVLSKEISWLLKENNISKDAKGLIVGLGNWHVTPDALGPMTTEKVLVTSHLFSLEDASVSKGYRPVAAVSPGVMGTTGIETSHIIKGVVDEFKPDFLIAIDALSARAVKRLNQTIQLSDSGIHPGSGVGNKRKELSKETLGIPVFAIGVPTVVDAVTISSDSIDDLLKHFGRAWKDKDRPSEALTPGGFNFGKKELTEDDLPSEEQRKSILGMLGNLSEEDKRALITEVLTPLGHNMIVTPKNVDEFMEDMSEVIAAGINEALHDNVTPDNMDSYTKKS